MKLQGYNHNIRHRGVLFHVQTEDYGKDLHLIVTQLFHSGQLITKLETDYQELIGQNQETEKITALMKKQHKMMLTNLTSNAIAMPSNITLEDESNPPDPST